MSPLPSHTARCCEKQRSRLRYGKEQLTPAGSGEPGVRSSAEKELRASTAMREEAVVGLFDSFLQPRRPSRPAIPDEDCSGCG